MQPNQDIPKTVDGACSQTVCLLRLTFLRLAFAGLGVQVAPTHEHGEEPAAEVLHELHCRYS